LANVMDKFIFSLLSESRKDFYDQNILLKVKKKKYLYF
jgi:hypothetical protein